MTITCAGYSYNATESWQCCRCDSYHEDVADHVHGLVVVVPSQLQLPQEFVTLRILYKCRNILQPVRGERLGDIIGMSPTTPSHQ